jgi:polyhydroxyalkanoate synthase
MQTTQELSQSGFSSFSEVDATGPFSALKKSLSIGSTPYQIVYREASLSLLKYQQTETTQGAPVLLVPSLINRHYILDLLPGKSLVEYLLSKGHAVYLVRWEPPGDEERWLTAERLIGGRLHRALSAVLRDSGQEKAHLIGQCIGGTIATAYAIRYPEKVQKLALLTTPVDFKQTGILGTWANTPSLDLDVFLEAYGNMPWPFMQGAFHLLRPGATVAKYLRATRRLGDKAFMKNFVALEIWANDNVSFPGSCYRTLIQTFYRENGLLNGSFAIAGKTVRLEDLSVPVLSLTSSHDHIVPFETTLQKTHLNSGAEFELIPFDGGHIGCLLGKKSQAEVWPRISKWLD